jgi:hypothetical protein
MVELGPTPNLRCLYLIWRRYIYYLVNFMARHVVILFLQLGKKEIIIN